MRALRLRPFSFEGLPHLPRAAVAWTRAASRARAGLPSQVQVTLPALGAVLVRPTRLSFVGDPEASGESFALQVRGCRGRLVVDLPLALRLVATVLGAPAPRALRPLGRAERGSLAAVVVAVLDAAGLGGAVRIGLQPAPVPSGDVLSLELRVRAGTGEGVARVELPVAALPAAPARPRLDPSVLALPIVVELARTSLEATLLRAAGPGDGIVFEGSSPRAAADPWPVDLRFGDHVLPAHLFPDGSLRRGGPLASHQSEVLMSSETDTNEELLPPLSDEAARALATAPVEIVAEIGRLTVRGDELVGLLEGGVLSLGARRPAAVQLRVGSRLWAVGELVAIDDELGVRITELLR